MEKPWLKSYAPGIPLTVKYEEITIAEALRRSAREFPDKDALIFLGARVSFRKLDELVDRFAQSLLGLGVAPGDRVAMLLPNSPQQVIASYAAWRIGAVVVMNNPLYTDPELHHQLNDSGAVVLVTLDLLAPRMIALRPKTKVKSIVVAHIRDHLAFPKKQLLPIVAKDKHRDIPAQPGVYEWSDLLKKGKPEDPGIAVDFQGLACLQYTGGTTGVSKGAMLTHAGLSCNIQQITAWMPTLTRGSHSLLGAIPFFHVFGLSCAMNIAVWMGWTDVLLPRPEPDAMLEAVEKYRISAVSAVPTLYVGMLSHPKAMKHDLTSLLACTSGAGPMPLEVMHQFNKQSGATIYEGYGLTEASPLVTCNPYGGKVKAGSIGLPIPDTEVRIVDVETGTKEMPVGEPGEIVIRGPQVMQGYYNRPDETAIAVRDGWLFTGDVGTMDDEGYFYIVDRKKDMIIAGGYNIYPRDIDEVLFEHPKVLEACAIGIPDAYRGETVKAFVVLRPGETATAEEIMDFCKDKLAAYKVPRIVEFINTLPKSPVGKILRKELRKMEMEKGK
jgi:long-chain acyl-CoA synthetase